MRGRHSFCPLSRRLQAQGAGAFVELPPGKQSVQAVTQRCPLPIQGLEQEWAPCPQAGLQAPWQKLSGLVFVQPGLPAGEAGQECVRGLLPARPAASCNCLPPAYGSPGDTPVGGQERRLVGRERAPAWGGVRLYM